MALAIWLVAVSIGLLQLLGFLATRYMEPSPGHPSLNSQLAQALANLLVGLPLWLRAWQPMQVEAAREDEIATTPGAPFCVKGISS